MDCFRTGLQCLRTVKVMLKEVVYAGRVDTSRERKCDWGVADLNDWICCHGQSQQKRSKNCSWEHFAFELLGQCSL